jgi:hypothetical protein
MVHDLDKALAAFRAQADRNDPQCVEIATKVFDWRMHSLDETGDLSTDESERLTTNCDRFLTEVGHYLESKGESGKSVASAVVAHIALFLVDCERSVGKKELAGVAEVLGICFAGSLADLRVACDAARQRKERPN